METMDAREALATIGREAVAKKVAEVRRVEAMAVGQVVRQGDVYLHRVADDHPRGEKAASRQLVRGVTVGSRHVVAEGARCFEGTAPPPWAREAILGPLVVAPRRLVVEHPEHAHLSLPAGTYQTTLQVDARTDQAVRD